MLSPKCEGREFFKILHLTFHAASAATSISHLKREEKGTWVTEVLSDVEEWKRRGWRDGTCPTVLSLLAAMFITKDAPVWEDIWRDPSTNGCANSPSWVPSVVSEVTFQDSNLLGERLRRGKLMTCHWLNGVTLTRMSWVPECWSQFTKPDSLY